MNAVRVLPPEGTDLRAELVELQAALVEQAMQRAGGDRSAAAKLLRITPLELVRMQANPAALARQLGPVMKQSNEAPPRSRPVGVPAAAVALAPGDLPRCEQGVERISRAVIRRLDAEGLTPRQIANKLSVNPFVVEKVLRMEAEAMRKCGPRPAPERERA